MTIPDVDAEFLREVWVLYGIGVTTILLRFATRIKTVGFMGFQGDDLMSILTLIFYTIDAVTVTNIYYTGTNVEASEVLKLRTLTADEIAGYRLGSIEQLVAWYSYTALIWTLKGSMLFFFYRLTVGLWQHRFIKWLALFCGISYVTVALTITFGCYPIHKNWQVVPDPGTKCTVKLQNFLVSAVLNVLTDSLILSIPIPLLWALRVPVQRKIIIGLLLCSGMFVIAAAIIRVSLSLGKNPSALNINRWGVRETIVGIITINLPVLRPLANRSFWSRDSFKSSSITHGASHNLHDLGSGGGGYELSSDHTSKGNKGLWEGNSKQGSKSEDSLERTTSAGADSQEFIIQGNKSEAIEKGVLVKTTFRIESEDVVEGEDMRHGWKYSTGEAHHKVSVQAKQQYGTEA